MEALVTTPLTTPLILSAWPRATARGAVAAWDRYFDGQIHVLPVPSRYKDLHSFRKMLATRAYVKGKSIRTCTMPEYPGCLVIQVTGDAE
jgi:hypothetical protein